jgi:hypothetical protein
VHAPSPAHATTAAILRSVYLTHQQSGSGAAAIDLSSTRVRLSQNLLDGIRSGQALGALLGYQLERALHSVTLDAFIAPLRVFAPIEGVTGDRTIDGLALLDQRSSIPWGNNGLPTLGSSTQVSVDAQISILADTVDAVSDLMLAESVHQLAGGNALRAGATVDAVGRGDTPPPVLEITRTPRRGGIVTHRLFATLGGVAPLGWPNTPRSQAEPRLAAFAASVLGAPARVLAGAQILGPDGTVIATLAMTLTDLALGPLDLLAQPASELALRFSRVAWSQRPSTTPAGSTVALNFARDPGWTYEKLSVNELLTVATSVSALIAGARAATAPDFATPDQIVDAMIDTGELKSRADAAVVALNTTLGHFADNTAADAALMGAAAVGVPNSVPQLDPAVWPAQTAAAQAELQSRVTQVAAFEAGFDRTGASETALKDHDATRLQMVFGAGFQVAAILTAAFAGTLPALFESSATLLANQPLAPVTWLARSARVRPGVARLSESLLYGEALGSAAPLTPVVAQLPAVADDVWAALPLKPGAMPADRLSLVAVGALQGASAALVIDEWTEMVPNATETTGLTFQVDAPAARAPQAILLGVQADTSPSWTIDSVEGTLLDAIDLAQLRTVDPDSLGDVGHFLPALLFAINLGNTTPDTISTDLTLAALFHRIIRPPPFRPVNPVNTER